MWVIFAVAVDPVLLPPNGWRGGLLCVNRVRFSLQGKERGTQMGEMFGELFFRVIGLTSNRLRGSDGVLTHRLRL